MLAVERSPLLIFWACTFIISSIASCANARAQSSSWPPASIARLENLGGPEESLQSFSGSCDGRTTEADNKRASSLLGKFDERFLNYLQQKGNVSFLKRNSTHGYTAELTIYRVDESGSQYVVSFEYVVYDGRQLLSVDEGGKEYKRAWSGKIVRTFNYPFKDETISKYANEMASSLLSRNSLRDEPSARLLFRGTYSGMPIYACNDSADKVSLVKDEEAASKCADIFASDKPNSDETLVNLSSSYISASVRTLVTTEVTTLQNGKIVPNTTIVTKEVFRLAPQQKLPLAGCSIENNAGDVVTRERTVLWTRP